jgi:hypothetical protein
VYKTTNFFFFLGKAYLLVYQCSKRKWLSSFRRDSGEVHVAVSSARRTTNFPPNKCNLKIDCGVGTIFFCQSLGQEIVNSSMSTPSAIELDTSSLLIAVRLRAFRHGSQTRRSSGSNYYTQLRKKEGAIKY